MDNSQWQKNYSNGLEINKYPIDDLVSFYFRYKKFIPYNTSKFSICEFGCGCGNNLNFFANEYNDITGIDISATAISHAKKLIENKNVKKKFIIGDILDNKLEDNIFDILVDRACITHNPNNVEIYLNEAYRILKEGGLFYSWIFGNKHSIKKYGKKYCKKGYTDFPKDSIWYNIPTFFIKEKDINKYYYKFNILEYKNYTITNSKKEIIDYFVIIAQKPYK